MPGIAGEDDLPGRRGQSLGIDLGGAPYAESLATMPEGELAFGLADPVATVLDAPRPRPAASDADPAVHGSVLTYGEGASCQPGDRADAPERDQYAEGRRGDDRYLDDFDAYTDERVRIGQNTVGPAGKEDWWIFELAARIPDGEAFGAGHDKDAARAELQAQRGGGDVNYTVMNALTAVAGWDATLNAGLANKLTGARTEPAREGVELARRLWELGGYDVSRGDRGGW